MANTSVNLPDEMDERIESDLSWGDSKSEWIRNSIRIRLDVDDLLQQHDVSMTDDEKVDFVESAVRDKLETDQNSDGDGSPAEA